MSWTLLVALTVGDPFMVSDFKSAEACHAAGRQLFVALKTATPVSREVYEGIRDHKMIPVALPPSPTGAALGKQSLSSFIKRYDCAEW